MKRALTSVARLTLIAVSFAGGCTSGEPPPGQGCSESGGVCTSAACEGESLPYPCNGSDLCCIPPKDGGAK